MLPSTVSALLESIMSYFIVAATVPKMGERDVIACCSANDTIVKVRVRGREHAHTRTHTTHTQSHWRDCARARTHRQAHKRSVLYASPRLAPTSTHFPWPTPSQSQVGTDAQLNAATESLTTTVPAAHTVINAANKKDTTSTIEAATVDGNPVMNAITQHHAGHFLSAPPAQRVPGLGLG